MKIIYFDVETTGLDPKTDYIFQLSGLVEVDGEPVEDFNIFLRPPSGTPVSKKALEVTGKTIEDLRALPDAEEGFKQFLGILKKYVPTPTWREKFYPAAYNGNFDMQFVEELFVKNGKYWGDYQNWQLIDPLQIFRFLNYSKQINTFNCKLSTICNHFGVSIDAHDALSDIRATRDLVQILKNGLKLDLWGEA